MMKNAIKGIPIVLFVAIIFVAFNLSPVRAGGNACDVVGRAHPGWPNPLNVGSDGWVNIWELRAMAHWWGYFVPPAPAVLDYWPDGAINFKDLAILGLNWGMDPPVETGTVTASSSTTVYINPQTTTAAVGKTITVNITVSAVSNLVAWQAGMTFNPNVLACLSVQEGPFLNQSGSTLWIAGAIENTTGTLGFSGCALIGNSTTANGKGTLATVKFSCKNAGSSVCTPQDVILVNSTAQEIAAAISNGTVNVSPAVGGIWTPVDKLALLTPYISLASTIIASAAATAIYAKHRKKKQ
jgi:hypothetical protein